MLDVSTRHRHLHVFDLALLPNGRDPGLLQIAAVRLDVSHDLHEAASFVRFVRPADGGIPLESAVQAFARFVGDDGALLSWGNEGGWLEESCLRAGLPCPVDPHRFGDAAPAIRKGVGAGELAPLTEISRPTAPHDALRDARAVARTLRWLHARGRL
jgi:hypothetical protein